ncbi:MAG: STAS domain-containing protein [Fibrobacter sp.]|nr:STAS domain-containing protein [Fibrobacter sp.]
MTIDPSAFQIKENYTLLQPKTLGPEEIDYLPAQVKDVLVSKKQNIIFSLKYIDTIFSSHLTTFVQIYRLLQSFNLQLIITDLSPAVLNVLQMTQLDSLLALHLTLQDFEDSLAQENKVESKSKDLDFSYEIKEEGGKASVICEGYMAFGQKIRSLQKELKDCSKISFDLTKVGYMDTRVLIMLSSLANQTEVEIVGASNVIVELFEQHRLKDKIIFID